MRRNAGLLFLLLLGACERRRPPEKSVATSESTQPASPGPPRDPFAKHASGRVERPIPDASKWTVERATHAAVELALPPGATLADQKDDPAFSRMLGQTRIRLKSGFPIVFTLSYPSPTGGGTWSIDHTRTWYEQMTPPPKIVVDERDALVIVGREEFAYPAHCEVTACSVATGVCTFATGAENVDGERRILTDAECLEVVAIARSIRPAKPIR